MPTVLSSTSILLLPPLDDGTMQAVQLLAMAVRTVSAPGVGATSDALTRTIASRRQEDLEEATRAFDALGGPERARIAERAYDLARREREEPGTLLAPQPGQAAGTARDRLMADLGKAVIRASDGRGGDEPGEDPAPLTPFHALRNGGRSDWAD